MTPDQVLMWCGSACVVGVTVFLWAALLVLGYVTYKYLKENP